MVVVLMVNSLTDLLKPKWLENRWQSAKTNNSFYDLKKDSTEVVFFGASVIAAAVDPFQLYEEQGISSYNLGVMSQPMLATYFWFKEALKTQSMKVAVIEIKSAGRKSVKAEGKARKSYDYMKWGLNKLQYAIEYKNISKTMDVGEEVSLMEYLFPLTLYHDRWSQLDYDDYDFFLGNDNSHTRGFATLTCEFKNTANFDHSKYEKGKYDGFEVDTDEETIPSAVNTSYLDRIIKLAEENNVKLLFMKTPDTKWSVKQHNYIQRVADENKIDFLDFNLKSLRAETGFEAATDEADVIHINVKGAKKITNYLGTYLTQNYELTDYRNSENKVKKIYDAEKVIYESAMRDVNLVLMNNVDDYLNAINDNDDYAVILTAGSNAKPIDFTENQLNMLKGFGLDWNKIKDNDYGTNAICVKDGKNVTKVIDEQDKMFTLVSTMNGAFNNGADYSIIASDKNCSVRLNDNAYTKIKSNCLNIIVYNKKLNEVADSIYLYSSGDRIVIGRED